MKNRFLVLLSFVLLSSCSQDKPVTTPSKPSGHSENEKITFKLKIENISKDDTLKTSSGEKAPLNISSGVWALFNKANPIFEKDKKIIDNGLESLAEDGDNTKLESSLKDKNGVISFGKLNSLKSGESLEISFSATVGTKLSFASMFVQSNDLFYSFDDKGFDLFDKDGEPLKGDITSNVILWDAGTEENQEPAVGLDQPLRQKAINTGKSESNNINIVKDSFKYPNTTDVLKITLENDDVHEHEDEAKK